MNGSIYKLIKKIKMPRGGGRSSSRGSSGGRSSGGGFFSRGPARTPAAAPRPPAQAPPRQAPPMAQAPAQGGGMMSGLAGTVMTGMAFGAGSEIAHQGVRAMMGGGSGHGSAPQEGAPAQQAPMQQQMDGGQYVDYSQQQANPCQDFNMNFIQCLKANANSIDMCQSYMNMLQQCEQDYATKQ